MVTTARAVPGFLQVLHIGAAQARGLFSISFPWTSARDWIRGKAAGTQTLTSTRLTPLVFNI